MPTPPEGRTGEGDRKARRTTARAAEAQVDLPLDPLPEAETETESTPPAEPPGRRPEESEEPEKKQGPLHFLRELPGLIVVALLLALLIKSFLIQAFFIPSESMVPTLEVGDRVLVNKVILNFRDPRRGEVVVFENPRLIEEDRNPFAAFWHWITEGLGFSSDPDKDFIKRVIGLPGDTIEVKGGKVFVNGTRLEEPYLTHNQDRSDHPPTKLGPDQFFVMGDNRANSQDSRQFGPIHEDKVVGKAFIILWPPSRFEWLGESD